MNHQVSAVQRFLNRPLFLKYLLIAVITAGTVFIGQAQTYNYYSQSFSITGSTSVCIDGTTTYTYSGPISTLTWTVTGGTFVGSNVGASVQVKWTSASNSLSATGDDTNCYYDPEYWPPQQFCDVTTYTSNAFSVTHAVTGGSVSGTTTLCSPGSGSLTLSGHTGTVARWEYSTGGSWTNITNTTTTLNYSGLTTTTSYRAVLQSGSCTATSSAATVTINSTSVGGTISGTTTLCSPGSGTLTLSGHNGSVVRWEYSTGGAWTTISNTTTSLNYSSLTATRSYRAAVKNGVCAEVFSSTATITINTPSVGGTTAGAATLCSPGAGTITLSGHTGSVVRWEYSTGGAWTTVSNTTTSLTYSGLTSTTNYRAVVKSGVCAEANSSTTTITINPTSIGGTVSGSTAYYGPGTGTLSLSGHTGSVVRWEYSTGGAWSTISNTTTSLNYNSLTVTTSYRAVVKSGVCAEATSATATIEIFPVVVVSPTTPNPLAPGGVVPLSANSGYYSYQWYYNGSAVITGGTAQQYDAREPGSYYVQVKGSVGSSPSNSTNIAVKGLVESYDQVLNSVSSTTVLTEGASESTSLFSMPAASLSVNVSYADGLGRVFQSIGVGQSPGQGDVVAVTAYRKNGLTDTTYLPYTVTTRDGRHRPNAIRGSASEQSYPTSEQRNFYQGTAKVAQDAYPYAVSKYANDPSLRVVEQGAPGLDWQPNSAHHTVRSTMALSDASTYKVRFWDTSGLNSGYYPDNSVTVSVTTDENNNKVQTYTDMRGLTVLKQVQMDETLDNVSTPWLETYYIYDELGRIKYILPPKAMRILGTGTGVYATSSAVAELIHTFVYDSRGRLVEKKVPGASVEYIVYDKLDRVVLTQDGNLRTANKWMFVKYDIYNRVVYSGIYKNTTQTTRLTVQALLDAIVYALPATPWYEKEQTGGVHGYSNMVFPTTGATANEILSVAYYDHYNFDRTGGDEYTYDPNHLTGQEMARSTATRGLPTGGKRALLDAAGNITSTFLISVVFYDKYDRPVQTLSTNHLYPSATAATLDKSTVLYDFVKALRTKTTHYQDAGTSITLEDYSDFDHVGRVTKTYRKINNGAAQLIAQYEYNALGQVVDKKLHEVTAGSGNFLQSVDYRYTIRGWLSSINNAKLNTDNANDETNDYFGMELLYQAVESGLGNTAYYNGNISATKWKGMGTSGLADQRSYKYAYDKSDRLKSATFQAHDGNGWAREVNTLDETMSYDHNGNILTLTRKENLRGNSGTTITSAPQTIDNLSYVYPTFSPNRHIKVEDASGSAKGFNNNGITLNNEYKYDTLGNLKEDKNKGISSISYNILGKPQVINFTSGKKIEYVYDAAGTKVTVKTYQTTTLLSSTNYAGSFVYEGATPVMSFFGSPEGRVVKNGSSYEYQYSISDHQGNTRVIFSSATPSQVSLTASFEGDASDNTGSFGNVNGSNIVPFTPANHTENGSKVIQMNQAYASGPSKSIKVFPGDKIDAEVWAYYEASSGYGTSSLGQAAMITAIASGFGGVSGGGGESGSIFNGVNSALGAFGLGGNAGDNAPAAYLNYILFDQQYKLLTMGWIRVPTSAYFSKQKVNLAQVNVKEAGYVFVYLSYEDQSNNYVYFDDFKVTHTKSNLIQGNEYYPFGMQTANSWTRENTLGNNFLANGGTELNGTSNLYDLDYRNYDQVLGRMNGVDPMATKFASLTPYNFSFNDPVTFTDVSGANPWDGPYGGSEAYYYGMQGQDGMSPGQSSIMDPFGGSWNPAQAGGYGLAGAGVNNDASTVGWFTGLQRSNVLRDAGQLSNSAFIARYGEYHGGGLTGLLSGLSSFSGVINWWLVYSAGGVDKKVSMSLYFDQSYETDPIKDPKSWYAAYKFALGARKYQGANGVDAFEDLAQAIIKEFPNALNTKKSLVFIMDDSQLNGGELGKTNNWNHIQVNISPSLLQGDSRLLDTVLSHEFKHVSDYDSGYSDLIWSQITDRKTRLDIWNAILEKRAYVESARYSNDKGWNDIGKSQNESALKNIVPSKYEKYVAH